MNTTPSAAQARPTRATTPRATTRRAFSLIEVLVALAITGTLLTATLAALDASFRSYKVTTEGASTNVVSRMVMHRMMSMIRTGTQFGPYPLDPLDLNTNPVTSDFIEFQSREDIDAATYQVVRVERREQPDARRGPFELWYVQTDYSGGVAISTEERPLLSGVLEAVFTLEYDVGPRLARATVDLTVRPNDSLGPTFGGDLEAECIRLVSSVGPRKLE